MGELMIRPKTLVYIKLSCELFGVEEEWESENKTEVGVCIDSFPTGPNPQRRGQEKREIQKQPSHSMDWTKIQHHSPLKADGNACHYLNLASMAFASTEQTYCFMPLKHHGPRTTSLRVAVLSAVLTVASGSERVRGKCNLLKVFSLSPRCEIEISAFRGPFMPATNTEAQGLHTRPN